MTIPDWTAGKSRTLRLTLISSALFSDRNVPAPIEKASTMIRMMPLLIIDEVSAPEATNPDKKPTLLTSASSRPKIALRKRLVL
jgi:hypothetical protein